MEKLAVGAKLSAFIFTSVMAFVLPHAAQANLSASPGSIFFFDEQVGGIGSSRSVTVRNNSNEPITGLSIFDNCFSDFQVSNYGCYGTLPAYGSCSLNVRFQPRMEGHLSCSIRISAGSSFTSVSVSGRGVARDRVRVWKEVLPE